MDAGRKYETTDWIREKKNTTQSTASSMTLTVTLFPFDPQITWK